MQKYYSSDAREYIRLAHESLDAGKYSKAERLKKLAEQTEETWKSEEAKGKILLKPLTNKGLAAIVQVTSTSDDAAGFLAKGCRTKNPKEKQRLWQLYAKAEKNYRKEHPCMVKIGAA